MRSQLGNPKQLAMAMTSKSEESWPHLDHLPPKPSPLTSQPARRVWPGREHRLPGEKVAHCLN